MSSELPSMYLKSIVVENAGPIPILRFDLPFRDDMPMPVVLVGPFTLKIIELGHQCRCCR